MIRRSLCAFCVLICVCLFGCVCFFFMERRCIFFVFLWGSTVVGRFTSGFRGLFVFIDIVF